jgi:hypothetical protein
VIRRPLFQRHGAGNRHRRYHPICSGHDAQHGNRDNTALRAAVNAYRATLGVAPVLASQIDSSRFNTFRGDQPGGRMRITPGGSLATGIAIGISGGVCSAYVNPTTWPVRRNFGLIGSHTKSIVGAPGCSRPFGGDRSRSTLTLPGTPILIDAPRD